MALLAPFASLPDIQFAVKDVTLIRSSVVTGMQNAHFAATGETISLAPADPRTLFLLNIVDLISAQRSGIDWAAKADLLAYATGNFLDHLGATYLGPRGARLPRSSAVTTLQFSLQSVAAINVLVPAGTQAGAGTIIFTTDADLIIPAGTTTGTITATCTTLGSAGNNFLAGQVSTLIGWSNAYTITVTNTSATGGGADAESDTAYAARLYLLPSALSKAGPRNSYQALALGANPIISDVVVRSVDEGFPDGEVHIFAIGQGGVALNAAVLAQIQAAASAEDARAIADHVFTANPVAQPFTVNVGFYIARENSANSATIITAVQTAGNAWITEIQSKIERSINGSRLQSLMLAAGASRIVISSPSDVIMNPGFIGVCTGTPIFNYLGLENENW